MHSFPLCEDRKEELMSYAKEEHIFNKGHPGGKVRFAKIKDVYFHKTHSEAEIKIRF